ncbi:MAG: hypothetical protein E6R13_09170 [Spirochaetes bacterium]|nr:MAG: hypothetical protein E6R13_09170 [Spirochaetota bacterium]
MNPIIITSTNIDDFDPSKNGKYSKFIFSTNLDLMTANLLIGRLDIKMYVDGLPIFWDTILPEKRFDKEELVSSVDLLTSPCFNMLKECCMMNGNYEIRVNTIYGDFSKHPTIKDIPIIKIGN